MGYNEIIKERLETVYKDTSIWEREWEECDFTKVEKITGKGVEIVDISDLVPERIKMITKRNYRWVFEQLKNDLGREPTIYDYCNLYTEFLKDLADGVMVIMCDNMERKLTVKTYNDSVYAYDKEVLKLEIVFNEYTAKLETSVDMTIKDFPVNLTQKEKDILNHLASRFYIKRNLTHSGLLPLFDKSGTKRLLAELYKCVPDYQDFQAFNFIKSNIETNLPDATLQNYCREVRKDVKR